MKTSNKQQGFHAIELVLVLAVVAVVGVVGYGVWHRSHKATVANSTSTPAAPQIKTAKDLDTASSTVDQLNTSASDSDLNGIEQDLNAL